MNSFSQLTIFTRGLIRITSTVKRRKISEIHAQPIGCFFAGIEFGASKQAKNTTTDPTKIPLYRITF